MSNRFHTKPRTTTVSADEINSLLNPNNTGASHDNTCGAPASDRIPTKEEILMARKEAVREAHADDYKEEEM